MSSESKIQTFAEGDVYFWIEQGASIQFKAVSAHGDPVELTADDARDIASALMKAANELDGSQ
jgi:hypothetical protein